MYSVQSNIFENIFDKDHKSKIWKKHYKSYQDDNNQWRDSVFNIFHEQEIPSFKHKTKERK